ncbi:MAG: NusG domain II-containing protein [Clostridia bacterium]|nr:NusG domain II-containing protein [Clostridia bacterium]MBQ6932045.1 NusG domain II-containing protein [Clostridia bacterium]MBR4049882.1 NusG domain II-containing protein [Clostridia bacterium]
MNKLLKPIDLILIAVLVLGCAGFSLYTKHSTKSATAVIYIDGEIYQKTALEAVEKPYELTLPCSPKATLLIENGAVSFCKADCTDKVCVNTGRLTKRGDTAACLPAKVVVVIENGEKNEVDAIVY